MRLLMKQLIQALIRGSHYPGQRQESIPGLSLAGIHPLAQRRLQLQQKCVEDLGSIGFYSFITYQNWIWIKLMRSQEGERYNIECV